MADDANPHLVSYSDGILQLSWSTPSACPKERSGGDEEDERPKDGSGSDGGGRGFGFWGLIKTSFWLTVFGLLAYFVIGKHLLGSCSPGVLTRFSGIYYNYSTYGARGMDLLPHREFWQDAPRMAGDLVGHVVTGVRGRASGSGRGGYQSLG